MRTFAGVELARDFWCVLGGSGVGGPGWAGLGEDCNVEGEEALERVWRCSGGRLSTGTIRGRTVDRRWTNIGRTLRLPDIYYCCPVSMQFTLCKWLLDIRSQSVFAELTACDL